MKRKPLQILLDKVGHKMIADFLNVNISVVYRWQYREQGKKGGRRPNVYHSVRLAKIANGEGIKSLTVDYLARL